MIIFHSGFEQIATLKRLKELVSNGMEVNGVLVSYLHLGESQLEYLRELKNLGVKIMLDSGAHSFLAIHLGTAKKFGHAESQKVKDILEKGETDKYVRNLIEFVKQNEDIFDYYIELDIQLIVGKEKVQQWRNQWKEKGLKPMYVWHGETMEEVDEWVKETDKLGLGATGTEEQRERRYAVGKQIKSRHPNVTIHAFAETGYENLMKIKGYVDTSDSTSWSSGEIFCIVYVINRNALQTFNKEEKMTAKGQIKRKKEELTKYGFDIDKLLNFDWKELNYFNLFGFVQLEKHLNRFLNPDQMKIANGRDTTGKFTKGNIESLKHGLQSKRLTVLLCDKCYKKDSGCEFYQPNAICAMQKKFAKLNVGRNIEKVRTSLRELINMTGERLCRGLDFESDGGGALDKAVDRVANNYAKYCQMLWQIEHPEATKPEVKVAIQQNVLVQRLDEARNYLLNKYAKERELEKKRKIEEKY